MIMTRSDAGHACDACGGLGEVTCETTGLYRCTVCLGAGRISDRMPVTDAIADAATFRFYALSYWLHNRHCEDAEMHGACCALHLTTRRRRPCPETAAELATDAAHAAFRAVPGLKGE